jgi:hypothetical protein
MHRTIRLWSWHSDRLRHFLFFCKQLHLSPITFIFPFFNSCSPQSQSSEVTFDHWSIKFQHSTHQPTTSNIQEELDLASGQVACFILCYLWLLLVINRFFSYTFRLFRCDNPCVKEVDVVLFCVLTLLYSDLIYQVFLSSVSYSSDRMLIRFTYNYFLLRLLLLLSFIILFL